MAKAVPRVVLDRDELPQGAEVPIDRELRRYLRGVLRLEAGAAVRLLDRAGRLVDAVVGERALRIIGPAPAEELAALAGPAPCAIEVMQALPKGDRFSEIVRRGTELGVARFVPVVTARTLGAAGRLERWRKIAREATRQSGRRTVPEVAPPAPLEEAAAAATGALRVLLYEGEHNVLLRDLMGPSVETPASVTLAVGPEGGFSEEEAASVVAHGFRAAGLGPRILRTETVALAVCAVIQHRWGDLG